jgi:hypothetical protein
MPRFINRHKLPEPLAKALSNDTYSKGLADASVTEIMSSPRQMILAREHADEIVIDVMDRFFSAMGTAIHEIIERGAKDCAGYTPEERLYLEIGGWIISGGVDLQKHRDGSVGLIDWKTTSCWALMNEKQEWIVQTNIYAHLVETRTSIPVTSLQIGAMARDWRAADVGRVAGYPLAPIVMIDIPLWSAEERARYIAERVRIHQDAQRDHAMGDPLPLCTPEEMWERDGQWAVIKKGAKRASRVLGSQVDAEQFAVDAAAKDGHIYSIEHRPGERIKCQQYCDAAPWCDQFQRYKELKNE